LPTRATPLIRRGTAVSLSRLTDPRSGKVGEWTADDRPYEYAQVAIAGRRFEEIRDEYDLNRPFRVIGRFEDEEIIELVNFVRSKANEERDGITIRAWPILSLDHDPRGSVRVMLWEKPHGGQTLLLRLEGKDNWVITAVGVWAA